MTALFRLAPEVSHALADGKPVVALESTVLSHHGLPSPANGEAARRCLAAVAAAGAVPAIVAVLDGTVHVGLDKAELARVLTDTAARKVAARDLPVAIARRTPLGVTTVSATLWVAHAVGISTFATGGIGGVHRGGTGDVSADLGALASHPVITVCAGAKGFLDLPRTLEELETRGVPVLGYRTTELPGFTTRATGLALAARVEHPEEAAAVWRAMRALGLPGGLLVAQPVPEEHAIPAELMDRAVQDALDEAEAAEVTGAAVTPFVLSRIALATEGRSVPANLALLEANAALAARIAAAVASEA